MPKDIGKGSPPLPMFISLCVAACALAALVPQDESDPARPASAPAAPTAPGAIPFARARFVEIEAPARPDAESRSRGDGEATASPTTTRRFSVDWPGLVVLDAGARAPRAGRGAPMLESAIVATHRLGGSEEDTELDEGATLSLPGVAGGTVRSGRLGLREALLDLHARNPVGGDLRIVGLAPLEENAKEEADPLTEWLAVRRGSVYPVAAGGLRLDAYFVRDAIPARETGPVQEGVAVAGAGDRPRRFMRGHRFTSGDGTVVSLRIADDTGASVRLSVAFPKEGRGAWRIPHKDVSVAITEIASDLENGHVLERVTGALSFEPEAEGGARLRVCLDAALRRIGARDPRRLLLFGEYRCVSLPLEELTPWLGRHNAGRPILETFAVPGEWDR